MCVPPGVHACGSNQASVREGARDEPVVELDERLVHVLGRSHGGELREGFGVGLGQLARPPGHRLGAYGGLVLDGQVEQVARAVQGGTGGGQGRTERRITFRRNTYQAQARAWAGVSVRMRP